MVVLRRNRSCSPGQRNADPASLQPSREGARGSNVSVSASTSSHLQAPASHWPNLTEKERGQAAQVIQSLQVSLEGTGQGG